MKSNTGIINDLLKLQTNRFAGEPIFKKTDKAFKKRYGITLHNAPLIFVEVGMLYKLVYATGNYRKSLGGRKFEIAEYMPMARTGKFFTRLSFEAQNK